MVTEFLPKQADVEVGDGRVAVTVTLDGRVSTALITRHGTGQPAKHVPIGTRKANRLSMTLDGEPVTLRPGPGRYMRGSYRVTVVHGAVTYRFRPKSPDVSRLTCDGRPLGDYELRADGTVGVTGGAASAVGIALAVAFGTGAQFFAMMLLDLLGHVPD